MESVVFFSMRQAFFMRNLEMYSLGDMPSIFVNNLRKYLSENPNRLLTSVRLSGSV